MAEVIFAVFIDKDLRGIQLVGSPEDARHALLSNGPVSLAPVGEEELAEYTQVVEAFTIHGGLVVASHYANETAAVITFDDVVQDAGVATIWK